MAIYCIQCGTSLPDDAVFCLKCGKQVKGGSASPTTSSSSETELYRCEITRLYRFDDETLGKDGYAVVTNRRIVFYMKNGEMRQIFLRDLEAIDDSAYKYGFGIIKYGVSFTGPNIAMWCKNKGENKKFGDHVQKALANM